MKKKLFKLSLLSLVGMIAVSCTTNGINNFTLTNNNLGTTKNTFDIFKVRVPDNINKIHYKASIYERLIDYMPHEIVIKYNKPIKSADYQALFNSYNLKLVKSIDKLNVHLVQTEDGVDLKALVNQLRSSKNVKYAELNYIVKNTYTPNDPKIKEQYALSKVKAEDAWNITKGVKDVVISIVDTGVDLTHPDLKNKIIKGYDAIDNDNEPMDGQGHGTHCAGIATAIADNGIGIAGLAPNCSLLPVRVLDNNGSGSNADVAEGIIWAADNGADIISLSLGGKVPSKLVEDAVKYALNKNVVVIAAMGNDGRKVKCYPAAIPGVIAVGSTDKQDKKSYFSNYGEWISVSAPGTNILSTLPTYDNGTGQKEYGVLSGTSMATPLVSGLAGLIKSVAPKLTVAQVKEALEKGDDLAPEGFDEQFGYGRINALNSLKFITKR